MRRIPAVSLVLAVAAAASFGSRSAPSAGGAALATASPSPFEPHWQDGRAEMDGYRYRVTRYGQERTGQALMIFVTEPFSESKRVKADDPRRNPRDTFEALKLNFVRDFQTGIYDYNTMVSVFDRSRDFAPAKISFSSAEWCGHVYEELIFEPHRVAQMLRSYFEDESTSDTLPRKKDGVVEDNLPILLRSLRGVDYLRPGERRSVPFLPSAFRRRLAHQRLAWGTATIERLAARHGLTVPAGRFEADVYVVRPNDGREGRFWIERAYPHRVLRWEWRPVPPPRGRMGGEGCDSGELAGSKRLPYWRLNAEGGEAYLRELSLTPGSRAP